MLLSIQASIAIAIPLDTLGTYCTSNPTECRGKSVSLLTARGSGGSGTYVVEVDPTTGQLPVDAAFTFDSNLNEDHDYGTPGANTLRAAAMLGVGSTAVSNANPVPVSDAGGSLTVDGTVAATQSGNWSVRLQDGSGNSINSTSNRLLVDGSGVTQPVSGTVAASNFPSTADTNSGAAGASTIRTVLATRHEAVATPLAVQLSNGSAAVAYDSGASGATVPRVVMATRHEAVATPLATQLSNGSAAISYGSGQTGTAVIRVVQAGKDYADSIRHVYSSTNVTTSAWVQIIASTAAAITQLYITDSCGEVLELGTGGAGAESRKLLIPRGGLAEPVNLYIASGTRVALKAVTATCSTGDFIMTGLN